jgi:hypothetical protein
LIRIIRWTGDFMKALIIMWARAIRLAGSLKWTLIWPRLFITAGDIPENK